MTSPNPAIDSPRAPALETTKTTTTATTTTTSHREATYQSLERLPNELLQPIAECLIPPAPLTTRFALRPSGAWEFRDAGHQWADWLAARGSLLAFAQASRRMAAVAEPFLYHTLVIPTARALVTLFRRMNERPEIRPWIRSVTCLVHVGGVVTISEVRREWQRQSGVSVQRGHDCTAAMDLLRAVLLNAPNLRDLLVAFPDQNPVQAGTWPADLLLPNFRDTILQYLTDSEPPGYETLPAYYCFPLGLMQNLVSLRIYCHRDGSGGDRDLTFSRMVADVAIASLPHLKSLRTLELCCSSAGNSFSEEIALPQLPQIEHLRFYGTHMHEPRLVAFCLACINLKTLVVHFESSSVDEDRDSLPEGKTLSDALAGLAGALETLELVALSEGHYLTRGRERPRKPENHRLRCIPELRRLRSLTLDYRGVFGTFGILDWDDGERLCQLLPPSLRDFTLVCEWGTASDFKQSYLANLDMVLHGVKCLCESPSHRLSSISLAIHSWPAESRFQRRFRRDLDDARETCARAGIKFRTFDLLPSYQDEDEIDQTAEEGHNSDAADEAGETEEGAEAAPQDNADEEEYELEEEDEASEYYFSEDDLSDPEREARRPETFGAFLQLLGEDHGHSFDELFYAYHEDRWDEYLF